MPEALHIRDAAPVDVSQIAAVHLRSWIDTYGAGCGTPSLEGRAATWAKRLDRRGADEQLLVAVLDASIVGFAWAGPTRDADDDRTRVAQIRSIHVDPQVQGRGVGSGLMREVMNRFAASGRLELTLWVVDDNGPAHAFYQRVGWRPNGARRREKLAMPGEDGPVVTVVRYRSTVSSSREALEMDDTAEHDRHG